MEGGKSRISHHAFTETDIRKAVGRIPIHRYPDLKSMNHPDDLFKNHNAVALLFLTEGQNEGHWLAVLDHGDHYEVFDSFGTAIDGDRKWLDKKELLEFDESTPLLSTLLAKGGKPVAHNTTKLQNDKADTCGRWIVWRILNANIPLSQFVAKMKGSGKSPDDLVTELTYDAVHI
jgi:hypothetical protein